MTASQPAAEATISMKSCSTSADQEFLLEGDGDIRLKSNAAFCVTWGEQHMYLAHCRRSAGQLFDMESASCNGAIRLKDAGGDAAACQGWCLALENGDTSAGRLQIDRCQADINEVFTYDSGNSGVASLAKSAAAVEKALEAIKGSLPFKLLRYSGDICGVGVSIAGLCSLIWLETKQH